MNRKMSKLSLALAAVIGAGASGVANAGALAVSVVEFTDFKVLAGDASSTTVLDASDFASLTFQSTGDVRAELSGAQSAVTDSNNGSPYAPIDLFAGVGSYAGHYTDNDFSALSVGGGYPNENFAIADQYESGAPINNLSDGVGGTIPTFADLKNASYVSLEAVGNGSASSNNGLTATMEFVLNFETALTFQGDLSVYMETFLGLGELGDASAAYSISFDLRDEACIDPTPFDGIDDCQLMTGLSGLAAGRSSGVPGSGIPVVFGAALGVPATATDVSFTSETLTAGNRYLLTARINTEADANFVPEPGSLALMGLGLLGVAGMSRKKKA